MHEDIIVISITIRNFRIDHPMSIVVAHRLLHGSLKSFLLRDKLVQGPQLSFVLWETKPLVNRPPINCEKRKNGESHPADQMTFPSLKSRHVKEKKKEGV